MRFLILITILTNTNFAQTDWQKWDKAEVNYQIPVQGELEEENNSGIGSTILSGLQTSYSFLISDVDGDNCPFHPTCSSFYISSIKETNILQGTLIFADRFTRDSNLFKSKDQYPRYISGKFFDPTHNHYLIQDKVIFYSRNKIVE